MQLVLILNRVCAKLFHYSPLSGFKFLRFYGNPLGRLKNTDMRRDRPGYSRAKYKLASPHRLTGERFPKELATDQFMQKIASDVEGLLTSDSKTSFVISGDPKVLGYFRGHLKHSRLFVDRVRYVDKDLLKVFMRKWPRLLQLREPNREPSLFHEGFG